MTKKEGVVDKKNERKDNSSLNLWEQYNNFVRSLHLKKKTTSDSWLKQTLINFLKKIPIIIVGAFLTSFAFYFLMDPNRLYNSDSNGLLQIVSRLIIGKSGDGTSWWLYHSIYYGLGILVNTSITLFLHFYTRRLKSGPSKWEITSTSVFYVLTQFLWTKFFVLINARGYLFSRFNPSGWRGISGLAQLSLTLPYYILIAIAAAFIHTLGSSLIVRAQASTGGLDVIFNSFLEWNKNNRAAKKLKTTCNIIIIFFTAIINFCWIDNDIKMRKSLLTKDLMESTGSASLADWKQAIEEANSTSDLLKSEEMKVKIMNVTNFLKVETSYLIVDKYPKLLDCYLSPHNQKIVILEEIKQEISNRLTTEKEHKESLLIDIGFILAKIRDLKEKKNSFGEMIAEISNNERLLATLIYIFACIYFTSKVMPVSQNTLINIHCQTMEDTKKGLKILAQFSPFYYATYRQDEKGEETSYTISCKLSKWNYYLYLPYLKKIGNTYEVSE